MKEKITELKQIIKHKQTKLVLRNPYVKKHLEELHRKFVIVTIDKASNNFAFICRKYYIPKLLAEVSLNKIKIENQPIHKHNGLRRKLLKVTTNTNIKYCKKFDLAITEQDKILPIMYWLPKMMRCQKFSK